MPVLEHQPRPRSPECDRQVVSSRAELIEAGVLRPGRGDPLGTTPVSAPDGAPTRDELLADDRGER
jgi:hypothetical protein